jgi:CDGSH-type Zn-finger protein
MQQATGKRYDLLDIRIRRADSGKKVDLRGDLHRALGRNLVSPPIYDLNGGTIARIVKRTRGGPYPVTIGGETKQICGCGLSNTQPFCNGTHKITRQEDPSKLYWYDEQGNRFETTDNFQDIRCPKE